MIRCHIAGDPPRDPEEMEAKGLLTVAEISPLTASERCISQSPNFRGR